MAKIRFYTGTALPAKANRVADALYFILPARGDEQEADTADCTLYLTDSNKRARKIVDLSAVNGLSVVASGNNSGKLAVQTGDGNVAHIDLAGIPLVSLTPNTDLSGRTGVLATDSTRLAISVLNKLVQSLQTDHSSIFHFKGTIAATTEGADSIIIPQSDVVVGDAYKILESGVYNTCAETPDDGIDLTLEAGDVIVATSSSGGPNSGEVATWVVLQGNIDMTTIVVGPATGGGLVEVMEAGQKKLALETKSITNTDVSLTTPEWGPHTFVSRLTVDSHGIISGITNRALNSGRLPFGTCDSVSGTAEKLVHIQNFEGFHGEAGDIVFVYFENDPGNGELSLRIPALWSNDRPDEASPQNIYRVVLFGTLENDMPFYPDTTDQRKAIWHAGQTVAFILLPHGDTLVYTPIERVAKGTEPGKVYLSDTVNATDTTQMSKAVTPKGVYDYVNTALDDVNSINWITI